MYLYIYIKYKETFSSLSNEIYKIGEVKNYCYGKKSINLNFYIGIVDVKNYIFFRYFPSGS